MGNNLLPIHSRRLIQTITNTILPKGLYSIIDAIIDQYNYDIIGIKY